MSSSYVPPHLRGKSATPFRKNITYKSVVLPMIGNKYVVVKYGKTGETTFIGGGCGKNENIRNCARKELAEESKNSIIVNTSMIKPFFSFSSNERFGKEKSNNLRNKRKVTLRYTVFKVNLSNKNFNRNIKSVFNKSRTTRKAYTEMNNIKLVSKNNLNRDPKLWNFMRKRVLSRLT